jgi:oligoendopeptidase F
MTHNATIHDVVTLAHEVGHAWHSHVLRKKRPLAASYPMTLAETASNFGEMILLDGLERDPSSSPALVSYLLDQQMNRATAYLVNIPMRYDFERRFYEERARGEVSTPGLCELMSAAQGDWYGDTLPSEGLDPMFWASKLHFFITGLSFYNFPYAFGYLLSQGLFARFKSEGPAFLPRYEQFLANTGSADCEAVVKETLGADITQPAFWSKAIVFLGEGVAAYEKLAANPVAKT